MTFDHRSKPPTLPAFERCEARQASRHRANRI